MEARTLRYTAGLSEQLNTPLSDGRTFVHRDEPIVVTNRRDFLRLIRSGKYEDVTPVSDAQETKPKRAGKAAPAEGTPEEVNS